MFRRLPKKALGCRLIDDPELFAPSNVVRKAGLVKKWWGKCTFVRIGEGFHRIVIRTLGHIKYVEEIRF